MCELCRTVTKIRNLRERAKMPLRKLASLLDIDNLTLSIIERNDSKLSFKIIDQITEISKTDKDALINLFTAIWLLMKFKRKILFPKYYKFHKQKLI